MLAHLLISSIPVQRLFTHVFGDDIPVKIFYRELSRSRNYLFVLIRENFYRFRYCSENFIHRPAGRFFIWVVLRIK